MDDFMNGLSNQQRLNIKAILKKEAKKTTMNLDSFLQGLDSVVKGISESKKKSENAMPYDIPLLQSDPSFKKMQAVCRKTDALINELNNLEELPHRKIEYHLRSYPEYLEITKSRYNTYRIEKLADSKIPIDENEPNSLELDIQSHIKVLQSLSSATLQAINNTLKSNQNRKVSLSCDCVLIYEVKNYVADKLSISFSGQNGSTFSDLIGVLLGVDNPSEKIQACNNNPRKRKSKK